MAGLGAHWDAWVEGSLADLRERGLLRQLRPLEPSLSATEVEVSRETLQQWYAELGVVTAAAPPQRARLKLFSLNDYMGLATHPRVCLAAARAAACAGMGPRASAVVGGYTPEHAQLEQLLAELKGTEAALLFPSGFAANQATISALASSPDCAVFSDALNHASIIDGARLAKAAGAALHVYRHNDLRHLERLLTASPARRKLVVTDSLFSMDGDFADLRGLAGLKQRHGFLLAADEAHATLVCGGRGGGAAEAAGVGAAVDVHIGTLSKAAGAQGGFVACSAALRSLLLNRGRPHVFSTALPLPTVAAAAEAVRVSNEEPWRRQHLWRLVRRLCSTLGVTTARSPIVPLVLGSERRTLEAAGQLLLRGFHVPAIRPPTVAPDTCRLRISLSAAHTTADVDSLAAALRECGLLPTGSSSSSSGPSAKL